MISRLQRTATLTLFVICAACAPTDQAQAPASAWQQEVSTDPMTGETLHAVGLEASVEVRDSNGRAEKPTLAIACNGGRDFFVSLLFQSPTFTSFGDNSVALRFDDEPMEWTYWDPGSGGDRQSMDYVGDAEALARYELAIAEAQDPTEEVRRSSEALVRRIAAAETLLVRLHPPLNSAQDTRFDLGGAAEAIAPTVEACGIELASE